MKTVNGINYLSIGEAAKIIGRGAQTIKNWYAFQDVQDADLLPEMITGLDGKGTRYFREEDVEKLKQFRDGVKYGMMAEISRSKWGIRGKQIEESSSRHAEA